MAQNISIHGQLTNKHRVIDCPRHTRHSQQTTPKLLPLDNFANFLGERTRCSLRNVLDICSSAVKTHRWCYSNIGAKTDRECWVQDWWSPIPYTYPKYVQNLYRHLNLGGRESFFQIFIISKTRISNTRGGGGSLQSHYRTNTSWEEYEK